jgi:hypothetical protein
MGYSKNATDDRQGYHLTTPSQTWREGESRNGVNLGKQFCSRELRPFGRHDHAVWPECPEHRFLSGVALDSRYRSICWHYRHLLEEVHMATQRHGQIVETPTEARQAEPGPSVLALLTVSTGLAVLILGVIWFVFFRM